MFSALFRKMHDRYDVNRGKTIKFIAKINKAKLITCFNLILLIESSFCLLDTQVFETRTDTVHKLVKNKQIFRVPRIKKGIFVFCANKMIHSLNVEIQLIAN